MKIRILKNFKKAKRIAGVKTNILKVYLQERDGLMGPVVLENGRVLGCVNLHYRIKCKSANCFLIQKEFGLTSIVKHNKCHKCHLEFVKLYEEDKIKSK